MKKMILIAMLAALCYGGRCEDELIRSERNVGRIVEDANPIVDAVIPFIPPPFNGIVSLVLAGLTLFSTYRAKRNKDAARSIITGIAKAMPAGITDEAASTFNANQTKAAKRIVDEVQGKTKISLPI